MIGDSGAPAGMIGDSGAEAGMIGDSGAPAGMIGDSGAPAGMIGDTGASAATVSRTEGVDGEAQDKDHKGWVDVAPLADMAGPQRVQKLGQQVETEIVSINEVVAKVNRFIASETVDQKSGQALIKEIQLHSEAVDQLVANLNTIGDDGQIATLDMQDALQKQQQIIQTLSTVQSLLHDLSMSITRKID
jgi:hypothetical protein